jgi:hypothetical protein
MIRSAVARPGRPGVITADARNHPWVIRALVRRWPRMSYDVLEVGGSPRGFVISGQS